MTKEEILEEIQRTAQANGGKPLGFRRFQETTGISPYDWGEHWPRFADAQREAGFEPNKLNTALDEEFVITKYIEVMRDLGKVPTGRELRVQRGHDPRFPDQKTFTRLGRRHDLLKKVLDYCRGKSDYADVVKLCEEALSLSSAPEPTTRAEQASSGFVYLAMGHRGEYKIGRTNLVDRRVSELGTTSPVELKLMHEIKTDDPNGVEAYWHRRFADRRMRGEWFKLTAADVKAFKRWRSIF